MDDEELLNYGYELCEFADIECDFCENIVDDGNLFWYRTSYEIIEGNYICRICAMKKIKEDLLDESTPDHELPGYYR